MVTMLIEQQIMSLLNQRQSAATSRLEGSLSRCDRSCLDCGGTVKDIGASVVTPTPNPHLNARWDFVQCESCSKTSQRVVFVSKASGHAV